MGGQTDGRTDGQTDGQAGRQDKNRRLAFSKRFQMAARGWWMVQMTIIPRWQYFLMRDITTRAAKESRPEVGSSRKRREAP